MKNQLPTAWIRLKALAIHTADEAGPSPGPDYLHGWGLMNTARAALLVATNAASTQSPHILEAMLPDGGSLEFPVTSDGETPLRVTLCWTDPAGPFMTEAIVDPPELRLVNDLDLRLVDSSGAMHHPWVLNPATPGAPATTGDNFHDNVEQVVLSSPPSGFYTVRVTHKGALIGGWQKISVIISGNRPMPAPRLVPLPSLGDGSFRFQFTNTGTTTFTVLATTNVSLPVSQWTALGTPVSLGDGLFQFTDPEASNHPCRFYLLQRP